MAEFTTANDAMDALEDVINSWEDFSDSYDMEAIFDEVFEFCDGYDEEQNVQYVQSMGWNWKDLEDDEFWAIVEKHEIH